MPSNHFILFHPCRLLPSIFPSIRVFSNESVLRIRWPKYWHFSISPSNEYSGLISFRMDWWDLQAVQGTLKSLLQHHISKASILDSVQLTSVAQSCLTLSNPMDCSTPVLSITNYQSLLKLMSIESVMGSNHLTLCHPLLLLSVFPSIRVFSNESFLCIRWPKY